MKTLIVILGPTASGKTALAIQLAVFLKTEIINADSRQFYKGMDIGTAKPTPQELTTVKHHFIDTLSPVEEYNVGNYETDALEVLQGIFNNKDQAILAGGSGLYINAICKGLDQLPSGNPEIRKRLEDAFEKNGIAALQKELRELDPEYYQEVDIQNPHRLIRAIEVCILSGEKFSALRKSTSKKRPFTILKIGLLPEREEMYQRINQRVDEMLANGLVEEARTFIPLKEKNALRTVGYQELFSFFENQIQLEEAIDEIKKNTRRYAKRQLTWFKKDPEIHWFAPESQNEIIAFLSNHLGI